MSVWRTLPDGRRVPISNPYSDEPEYHKPRAISSIILPQIPVPNISISKHAYTTLSGFTNPNATCPECGMSVYFYRSPYGGAVFFDELGPPWPKHPCTSVQVAKKLPKKEKLSWITKGWLPLHVKSKNYNTKQKKLYITASNDKSSILFPVKIEEIKSRKLDFENIKDLLIQGKIISSGSIEIQCHDGNNSFTTKGKVIKNSIDDNLCFEIENELKVINVERYKVERLSNQINVNCEVGSSHYMFAITRDILNCNSINGINKLSMANAEHPSKLRIYVNDDFVATVENLNHENNQYFLENVLVQNSPNKSQTTIRTTINGYPIEFNLQLNIKAQLKTLRLLKAGEIISISAVTQHGYYYLFHNSKRLHKVSITKIIEGS